MVTTSRDEEQTAGLRCNTLASSLRAALVRYVRLPVAAADVAEDLVQDAFTIALRREHFDASAPGAVFTFLRTTARHFWLQRQRGTVTQVALDEADAVWDARCGRCHRPQGQRRCAIMSTSSGWENRLLGVRARRSRAHQRAGRRPRGC